MLALDLNKLIRFRDYYEDFVADETLQIFAGGKYTRKSFLFGAAKTIVRLLQNPNRNSIVLRKYANTNKNSTFAAIRKVINIIEHELGWENFSGLWEFRTSRLEIEFKPTGQIIFFGGFDEPSKIASFSVSKYGMFIDDMWIEEILDVEDSENADGKATLKLITKKEFETILSSGHRYTPTDEVERNAQKQTRLTQNVWNPQHFTMADYVDKYLPFDREVMYERGIMRWVGEIEGESVRLTRTNYRVDKNREIIPAHIFDKNEALIGTDLGDVMALGKTADTGGAELKNYIPLIEYFDDNPEMIYPLGAGYDDSEANNTGFSVIGAGVNQETGEFNWLDMQVIRANGWNNKGKASMERKNNMARMRWAIEQIIELSETYPLMKKHYLGGFPVFIDFANRYMLDNFRAIAKAVGMQKGIDTSWINFVSNSDKFERKNHPKQMVIAYRELIANGILSFHNSTHKLIKELEGLQLINGKYIDGGTNGDDISQATWYILLNYLPQIYATSYDAGIEIRTNDE